MATERLLGRAGGGPVAAAWSCSSSAPLLIRGIADPPVLGEPAQQKLVIVERCDGPAAAIDEADSVVSLNRAGGPIVASSSRLTVLALKRAGGSDRALSELPNVPPNPRTRSRAGLPTDHADE